MPIKDESLKRLKELVDLRDVVKDHISLKKEGSTLKGICPFHDEKTPSFQVESDHFHCYGCKEHGDAIDFLQKHTGITFQEAASSLAERIGFKLEYTDAPAKKLPHYDALKKIEELYSFLLLRSEGGHKAMNYLHERGFDNEDITRFGLGLVPKSGDFWKLFNDLVKGGKPIDFGILVEGFQGRIAFPVRDAMGRTIAFSCRKLEGDGAKYINSTETAVFKKGAILYGFDLARKRITKEKTAILVEGQFDVMRLVKVGYALAVCPLGTALTKDQVLVLKKAGVEKVFTAFDGDKAGRKATITACSLLQAEEIEPLVLPMPEGEDCDSLILKKGYPAFEKLLANPVGFIPFMAEHFLRLYGRSANGKNKAFKECSEIIKAWGNPIIVKESMRELAKALEVEESDVLGAPPDMVRTLPSGLGTALPAEKGALFGIFRSWGNPFLLLCLKEEDFFTPLCSEMFSLLKANQHKLVNELEDLFHKGGLSEAYTHLQGYHSHELNNPMLIVKALRRGVALERIKELRAELKRRSRSGGDISGIISAIRSQEERLSDLE